MTTKHGFTEADWDKSRKELRQALIARAKLRGMIPYCELVDMIATIRLEPHSQSIADMLREVAVEEDAAGRGMLTVIVVHKVGDMQPGPGFFDVAKQRGRDTSDILKCWVDELKKVHGVWSKAF